MASSPSRRRMSNPNNTKRDKKRRRKSQTRNSSCSKPPRDRRSRETLYHSPINNTPELTPARCRLISNSNSVLSPNIDHSQTVEFENRVNHWSAYAHEVSAYVLDGSHHFGSTPIWATKLKGPRMKAGGHKSTKTGGRRSLSRRKSDLFKTPRLCDWERELLQDFELQGGRRQLNEFFLSPEGMALLEMALESGQYRVSSPEEAAIPVIVTHLITLKTEADQLEKLQIECQELEPSPPRELTLDRCESAKSTNKHYIDEKSVQAVPQVAKSEQSRLRKYFCCFGKDKSSNSSQNGLRPTPRNISSSTGSQQKCPSSVNMKRQQSNHTVRDATSRRDSRSKSENMNGDNDARSEASAVNRKRKKKAIVDKISDLRIKLYHDHKEITRMVESISPYFSDIRFYPELAPKDDNKVLETSQNNSVSCPNFNTSNIPDSEQSESHIALSARFGYRSRSVSKSCSPQRRRLLESPNLPPLPPTPSHLSPTNSSYRKSQRNSPRRSSPGSPPRKKSSRRTSRNSRSVSPSPRRYINSASGDVLLSVLTVADLQSRARILSEQPDFRNSMQSKVIQEFWPVREILENMIFDTCGEDGVPFDKPVDKEAFSDLCRTFSNLGDTHIRLKRFRRGNTAMLLKIAGRSLQQFPLSTKDKNFATKICQDILNKRGRPKSEQYERLYEDGHLNLHNHAAKGQSKDVLAKIFARRLEGLNPYSGIEPGISIDHPVTQMESENYGIPMNTIFPTRIKRWVQMAVLRPINDFIETCLRKRRKSSTEHTREEFYDCHAFERASKVNLETSIRFWEYAFLRLSASPDKTAFCCPEFAAGQEENQEVPGCHCHKNEIPLPSASNENGDCTNAETISKLSRQFGACFARENLMNLGYCRKPLTPHQLPWSPRGLHDTFASLLMQAYVCQKPHCILPDQIVRQVTYSFKQRGFKFDMLLTGAHRTFKKPFQNHVILVQEAEELEMYRRYFRLDELCQVKFEVFCKERSTSSPNSNVELARILTTHNMIAILRAGFIKPHDACLAAEKCLQYLTNWPSSLAFQDICAQRGLATTCLSTGAKRWVATTGIQDSGDPDLDSFDPTRIAANAVAQILLNFSTAFRHFVFFVSVMDYYELDTDNLFERLSGLPSHCDGPAGHCARAVRSELQRALKRLRKCMTHEGPEERTIFFLEHRLQGLIREAASPMWQSGRASNSPKPTQLHLISRLKVGLLQYLPSQKSPFNSLSTRGRVSQEITKEITRNRGPHGVFWRFRWRSRAFQILVCNSWSYDIG